MPCRKVENSAASRPSQSECMCVQSPDPSQPSCNWFQEFSRTRRTHCFVPAAHQSSRRSAQTYNSNGHTYHSVVAMAAKRKGAAKIAAREKRARAIARGDACRLFSLSNLSIGLTYLTIQLTSLPSGDPLMFRGEMVRLGRQAATEAAMVARLHWQQSTPDKIILSISCDASLPGT